ncbi:hypothetical protein TNCV_2573571 [Trichonephila clavipes]|nr:hypothetical protein TNCV_2573571 [Trichonephila clavipes]
MATLFQPNPRSEYCGGLYSTRKKYSDVSETHSEKRKFGKAGESSVNKKARREVSKKYGKFTEDCIPDGVFPIGDDVFVFLQAPIMIPYQYT